MRDGSRGPNVLRWAERLLVIAGVATLGWCGLLVTDAVLSQRNARRSLEAVPHADAPVASPRAPEVATPVTQPERAVRRRGDAIADLSIPRIELSAVVLHGSDAQTLRRGPGHLENTALPGESGNAVIAGHRDTFFRGLRNVRLGDDVVVDTPRGRAHYRVTSLEVVNSHDLSVLEPTDEAVLTLITCYPFWVLGNAPDRFVVRAIRVDQPVGAALTIRSISPREPTVAPVIRLTEAASVSVVSDAPLILSDEALVREAIERFRLTYNARLISHNDVGPDGPLRFQACDVIVADQQAAATCDAVSQAPDARGPHAWTFALARAGGGWAIRTMTN